MIKTVSVVLYAACILLMSLDAAYAAEPKLYLSLYDSEGVAQVDTVTYDAWGVIKTGKNPARMVTDGTHVYVGMEGEEYIAVIDSALGKVVGTIKDVNSNSGMDITPDKKKIVTVSGGGHNVSVIDVDSLKVIGNAATDECNVVNAVKVSRDGKYAYVFGGNGIMQVIDLSLNKSVKVVKIPERVEDAELSGDGKIFYLNAAEAGNIVVFDVEKMEVLYSIPGGGLGGLALSPDGEELWYGGPGRTMVSVYSLKGKRVISQIPRNTDATSSHILFSPDGKSVLIGIAGSNTDRIYVIDAASKAKTGEIKVKGGFYSFVFVPE